MNPARYISAKKSMQPIANHPQARILSPKQKSTTQTNRAFRTHAPKNYTNPFFIISQNQMNNLFCLEKRL